MWRNTVETAGGLAILGTPLDGVLGSIILASTSGGDFGAGVFAGWSIDPTKTYRALITGSTFAPGEFWLNEDGSGYATGEGHATVNVYENNILLGSVTLTVTRTTVIEDLYALLQPLATGGAWYEVDTTQAPVYPFVRFARITTTPNVTLDGPSDLQNTRFQIDVFSRQVSEASAIAQAIDDALLTWGVPNVLQSAVDGYEPEVRAFRVTQDISAWAYK